MTPAENDASAPLHLALVQMRVDPDAHEANLARAEAHIATAAAVGAEVVLLPEALPLGWMAGSTAAAAEPVPDGGACRRLCAAAARSGVYVCSGLVERDGTRVYNAAVLVGPDGQVLLHHRKIHEIDVARATYATGDRLGVVETRWGRVGVMICADAFAEGEVLSRALAAMGARVILSPCAWAVPPAHDNATSPYGALWRDCYGAVAASFGVSIAGASCVGPITAGPWAGHQCIGCSLVVGPDGLPVLTGPYGADAEAILYARIASAPVTAS